MLSPKKASHLSCTPLGMMTTWDGQNADISIVDPGGRNAIYLATNSVLELLQTLINGFQIIKSKRFSKQKTDWVAHLYWRQVFS